jgi:hypothetical protein
MVWGLGFRVAGFTFMVSGVGFRFKSPMYLVVVLASGPWICLGFPMICFFSLRIVFVWKSPFWLDALQSSL